MRYALFDTELGTCAIAWTPRGIRRVCLPDKDVSALEARLPRATRSEPAPDVRRAIGLLQRQLAGKPARFDALRLDLEDTPAFHRAVYQALRRVPRGATISYGELASEAGSPGAARAVGQAMAQNPLPLIVPCHRVLAAGGKPGGFSAYGGTVTKARLLALEGVDGLFEGARSLPFDAASAVRRLRRTDPALGNLIRRAGPLRLQLKKPESTFVALAEAIVYQQLTTKAAATIFARVRQRCRPFRANTILRLDDDALRACGLSRSKAASLRDLADRTARRQIPSLPRLAQMDDEAIVENLTSVRGIGRWTVEMLLIFQLGRPDVLPIADYGLRKGFARAFGLAEPPPPAALEERGNLWRPYRTVASWYLWRANEL